VPHDAAAAVAAIKAARLPAHAGPFGRFRMAKGSSIKKRGGLDANRLIE
jgi:hypothetical protein